jgi:hypothetical protein
MRKVIGALLICCAVSAMGALPATARDFPFCIKGCDFAGGRGDCSFSSYQQCQASASGRDAYCDTNPYFSANAEVQPDRGQKSRRRF